MTHRVLGIRHHGPGSAHSVRTALQQWQPDCVLIEGPPEADDLIALAHHADMVPPVALLAYLADSKAGGDNDAVFYPFAKFSPEWIAIQWALAQAKPVRFIDLPLSHQLQNAPEKEAAKNETEISSGESCEDDVVIDEQQAWQQLADVAGFADAEALWDRLIETRDVNGDDAYAVFTVVNELMAELRASVAVGNGPRQQREARREAYMRQQIRRAIKEGYEKIAVICGAWHAPELQEFKTSAAADSALLKGLPKNKIAMTWIPWTYGRLATQSGYGAGITSPGWYDYLFDRQALAEERWFTEAALVFRRHQFDVSSAHIIEAVQLARNLAHLRGYQYLSLRESLEAIEAIYCAGDNTAMRFLSQELLVSERMGTVPATVPDSALIADLKAKQKTLRLKVEASHSTLDLDLRNDTDRARSFLLHKLNILNVNWGVKQATPNARKNTFHEIWSLAWQPELALRLIEASRLGNSIDMAAHNALLENAQATSDIAVLAELLQQALLADCTAAIARLTQRLDDLAASTDDVSALMRAINALAPVLRYGDVRKTDSESLSHLLLHYSERSIIGLPRSVCHIADDLAEQLAPPIATMDHTMRQLADQHAELDDDWKRCLMLIARASATHPLIAGRCAALLQSRQAINSDQLTQLLQQALSPGVLINQARWLEGLLADGGLFLLHDKQLLAVLDGWLSQLSATQFADVLPIVRRAFAHLAKAERRQIGHALMSTETRNVAIIDNENWNWTELPKVLPILQRILKLDVQKTDATS